MRPVDLALTLDFFDLSTLPVVAEVVGATASLLEIDWVSVGISLKRSTANRVSLYVDSQSI